MRQQPTAIMAPSSPGWSEADLAVLDRLRHRDEDEFARILTEWSPAMIRVAAGYVGSRHAAEDVVQETWAAFLTTLDRFQGRSSLRTWAFAILVNQAKSRAARDRRVLSWSTLPEDPGPTVEPTRFRHANDPFPRHWTDAGAPTRQHSEPEQASLATEARAEIALALAQLPARQRIVVTLRDVTGLSAEEACEMLGISAQNQRVLLHRGRAHLRSALERYYRG